MTPDQPQHRHFPFKSMLMQRLHSIFVRDESRSQSPEQIDDGCDDISPWPSVLSNDQQKLPRPSKDKERPITGLPRQATFRRQNSERRERLCPVEPLPQERRTVSASRHVSTSSVRRLRARSSPPPTNPYHSSAPAVASTTETAPSETAPIDVLAASDDTEPGPDRIHDDSVFDYEERPSRPHSRTSSVSWMDDEQQRAQLQMELDTRWILNLSMHFRDKSDREKFFVTYAETPTRWRRVTVSCDYRDAEPGSLENDLRELQFQRDKSLAVYEAIRESLPDIQFYETVTNLKLETSEGRLHVHVTEDVNEIIQYPSRCMVRHILDDENHTSKPLELCEKDIAFDAHLSGFVYRVWHESKVYIKKEIPSPDTIDEFLYEINALHALQDSENVIKLEAIILDDHKQVVKGLLISHAERGAVVDLLYDDRGRIPWHHRELWARQAIIGLRDIHEEGYVQGDFTLSNIVVDEKNDAKIIDINRRGCPVGWEPPEIAQKIASNQRISMYIGEKSDLYQLGMTLWALAMDDDEPERHDPPLMTDEFPSEVPEWFRNIVRICLSQRPRDRLSAKELVKLFPLPAEPDMCPPQQVEIPPRPHAVFRTEPKHYIDPNAAVERDDLERFKQEEEELLYSPQSSKEDWTFTYPISSDQDFESSASGAEGHRGRRPVYNVEQPSIDEQMKRTVVYRPNDRAYRDADPLVFEPIADQERKYDGDAAETSLSPVKNDIPSLGQTSTTSRHERFVDVSNEQATGCLSTMTLAPTIIAKSPSPFRLPVWRRSLSESTPRNSGARLGLGARSESPEVSPRSTSISLPGRPQSAEPASSARSSNETISVCGGSVGETTFSGTTCFTDSSARDDLHHKTSRPRIPDEPRHAEATDPILFELPVIPSVT
ncbi:hypothetical protein OHC33_010115 [Knufia fluminis]|uniref:Protein kinase domain-containing protein n=2 Tax=Knufia TaxID=430999 RepID=A0AAN8E8J7_9EURO|nr:hypothetical protein OHC33_010115 [Knufia fluminis]